MVINAFLLFLGFMLACSARWAFSYFGLSCFEQIIFHLKVPLEGVNPAFIKDWVRLCLGKALVLSAACAFLLLLAPGHLQREFSLLAFLLALLYAAWIVGLFGFILHLFQTSRLYEEEYVDGREVRIAFPQKKRNLIHIFVESMETTYLAEADGGNYAQDLMPELSALAKEHVNFSHTEKLGGAHVVAGTGWTTGGIVAQSGGIPLFAPLSCRRFQDGVPFYPGAYTLEDILAREGYQQEYLIGSDAYFGGRKFYYDTHGGVKICDIRSLKQEGRLPKEYRVFWGFEDEKLFSFAKEELSTLSKGKQPFHFTMLTVDTHHPYGYRDEKCKEEYPEQLSNIIRESSRKLGAFMEWLKQQPFYEDTTIVISGDHTSMAAEYIRHTYDKEYERTVFHTIIHSVHPPLHHKNRIFTSMDMFPTILTAMGAKIEGDRLGLGVDLFSGKRTLAERMGLKKLDQELRKQSPFYKKKLMKRQEEKSC